jgi:hypothetical protein
MPFACQVEEHERAEQSLKIQLAELQQSLSTQKLHDGAAAERLSMTMQQLERQLQVGSFPPSQQRTLSGNPKKELQH